MFGINKLKARVEELEERIKELKTPLEEIDERIWKLENPPKFKRGDRVDIREVAISLDDYSPYTEFIVLDSYTKIDHEPFRSFRAWYIKLVTQQGYEVSLPQRVLVLSKTKKKK